jgi:hypothetical protein
MGPNDAYLRFGQFIPTAIHTAIPGVGTVGS